MDLGLGDERRLQLLIGGSWGRQWAPGSEPWWKGGWTGVETGAGGNSMPSGHLDLAPATTVAREAVGICRDPRPATKTGGGQRSMPGLERTDNDKKRGSCKKRKGEPHHCRPGRGAAAAVARRGSGNRGLLWAFVCWLESPLESHESGSHLQ